MERPHTRGRAPAIVLLLLLPALLGPAVGRTEPRPAVEPGMAEFRARNYAQAAVLFEQTLKDDPANANARFYAGSCYQALKQPDAALPHFRDYLLRAPLTNPAQFAQALTALTNIHRTARSWTELADTAAACLRRIPAEERYAGLRATASAAAGEARRNIADAAFRRNEFAAALADYQAAVEFRKSDTAAWEGAAQCCLQLGRRADARADYAAGLAQAPDAWPAKFSLTAGLAGAADSAADWRWAEELTARDETARRLLAIFRALREQAFDRAFPLARQAEQKFATKGDFCSRLAWDLSSRNQLSPEFSRFFLDEYPEHRSAPWVLDTLLRKYQGLENKQQAREQSVALLEELQAAHPATGLAQQAALRLVDTRFIGIPETAEILEQKVDLYGRFRTAFPDSALYTEALRRAAELLNNRLGDSERAAPLYAELVDQKKQTNLTPALAACYAANGAQARAVALLTAYVKEHEKDYAARQQLGQALLQSGAIPEGVATLQALLRAAPDAGSRERSTALLKEYTEIAPGGYTPPAGTTALFVETTARRCYSTNAPALRKGDPVIRQEVREITIYPLAASRGVFPLSLQTRAADRRTFPEPAAGQAGRGVDRSWEWVDTVPTLPAGWQPKHSYRLLYPWQEGIDEPISIERSFRKDNDQQATVTIRANFPTPDWSIEVFYGPRAGKIDSIDPTPAPESPFAFRYAPAAPGTAWTMTIRLTPNASVTRYLPRVRATSGAGRADEPDRAGATLDFPVAGDATFRLEAPAGTVLHSLTTRRETVCELDEVLDYQ